MDVRSVGYVDAWLREAPHYNPAHRRVPLSPPGLPFIYKDPKGLWLPLSLADLTVVSAADLSFNNSQNWTVAANLTGTPTWCRVIIHDYTGGSGAAGSLSVMTWNGVDISGHYHANAATTHRVAGILAEIPFAVGANTGSHNFHFVWSVATFLDIQLVWGTGDLDAGVVDGSFVDSECVASSNVCTPTPYTTTTDRALPVFSVMSDGNNGTLSSGTGTTKNTGSALDSGIAAFSYPLKTPAGATTGTFGLSGNVGNTLIISYALKPSGGGGGGGSTGGAAYYYQMMSRLMMARPN